MIYRALFLWFPKCQIYVVFDLNFLFTFKLIKNLSRVPLPSCHLVVPSCHHHYVIHFPLHIKPWNHPSTAPKITKIITWVLRIISRMNIYILSWRMMPCVRNTGSDYLCGCAANSETKSIVEWCSMVFMPKRNLPKYNTSVRLCESQAMWWGRTMPLLLNYFKNAQRFIPMMQ